MKSQIGLEHINSQRQGRITHTVPGIAEASSAEAVPDKPASNAAELVPVVVHVEKGALDELLSKNGH